MNYSEEEKEAIEKLEFFKETGYATFMIKYDVDRTTANGMIKRTIATLLNLIQKQEKEIHKLKIIIENMAEDLAQGCNYEEFEYQKQKIIESFKKEVEKDEART